MGEPVENLAPQRRYLVTALVVSEVTVEVVASDMHQAALLAERGLGDPAGIDTLSEKIIRTRKLP